MKKNTWNVKHYLYFQLLKFLDRTSHIEEFEFTRFNYSCMYFFLLYDYTGHVLSNVKIFFIYTQIFIFHIF